MPRRWAARAALAITIAVLAGWSAFSGARQLESDNGFCISCHVDGKPMHQNQHRQLSRGEGGTLVAAHATTVRVDGHSRPMRCIDCHRGTDRAAQLQLDWIAVKDLATHLSGRGAEPEGVSMAVADGVCTDCHQTITGGRFHTFTAHRGGLTVHCVECHRGHFEGPGPAATDPIHTETLCARCHPGLAEQVKRVAHGLAAHPANKKNDWKR